MTTTNLTESLSGVRGRWGESITPAFAERYAAVFTQWVRAHVGHAPRFLIGMDTRASSPRIRRAMIAGMRRGGAHAVLDIGVSTTPAAFLSVPWSRADAGIMITASHNEPPFNGWKFIRPDGSVLHAEDMATVQRRV
ncbi:MAG: hypothetical protein HY341_02955, partial [Candidatus Kerfeldbacteria bacterium]|nr:hypothetical protein [Candidatus Kerfeldbacteria bacterium]